MDETQLNKMTQLLYACYSYLKENGLLDDFSAYSGIPMGEGAEAPTEASK